MWFSLYILIGTLISLIASRHLYIHCKSLDKNDDPTFMILLVSLLLILIWLPLLVVIPSYLLFRWYVSTSLEEKCKIFNIFTNDKSQQQIIELQKEIEKLKSKLSDEEYH